jgi:hypothetical protein
MSDDDQLTGSAELRALRVSLSGVAMPGRPRLEAITARGRARRRRRLSAVAGLSAAGAAAGTALALGLRRGAVPPPHLVSGLAWASSKPPRSGGERAGR